MSEFSIVLVRLRKQAGLSQQELADKLGVSRSRIGMYETGKREPDLDDLQKIAAVLGTTSGVLLGEANLAELIAAETGNKPLMAYYEGRRTAGTEYAPADLQGEEQRLLDLYRALNEEGQEKLVDYADDLVTSGKYIKSNPAGMVREK